MTHRDIMAWGKRWHYPYLQIGAEATPPTPDVLSHGKEHYEQLRHEPKRRKLTALRIERWMARLTRVQVEQVMERVDVALSKQSHAIATKEEVEA